ncbi:WEB family protein At5g55860 [Lathyrus oleraceus]|uniref:WEB family protein At5g55860 n=1 Tax=Pisum sativum TaxID=3888 RepID=UPI0021D06483|nr:WEB family protein At5g55860-like [Pisum sativum]
MHEYSLFTLHSSNCLTLLAYATFLIQPIFHIFIFSVGLKLQRIFTLYIKKATMVARIRKSVTESHNSTKPVVGEVDTNPPIQSVKDAVYLFDEGAFSGENPIIKKSKSKSYSVVESVWAKETKLHLAQKELNRLKTQLKNAEATKAEVLVELEKAKTTVMDLKQKLKVLSESRELAIQATEAAKSQVKQLKEEKSGNLNVINGTSKEVLEAVGQRYKSIIIELDDAKQELRKIRQECLESVEARVSAFKQAEEARDAIETNEERAHELFNEILAVQESIRQMKVESVEVDQQKKEILVEKNVLNQSYEPGLEEYEKNLLALNMDFSSKLTKNLEVKLTDKISEISALQKEIENKKTSDFESVKTLTLVLNGAKESLQKLSEEEESLRCLVEALRLDLEYVKREHSELKEKECKTGSILRNLRDELEKRQFELDIYLAEESEVRLSSEKMISMLNQLSDETDKARREAEDMKLYALELKVEAELTKRSLEEAEKKLKVALEEVEAAKAAEASILDQIKDLSEKANAARNSVSESGARITISREEFDSLHRMVEEFDKLASSKEASATALIEAAKASEIEALKKLEETQKEIENIKKMTHEVLRKTEMAEAAKNAVETELKRWRERDHEKAAETAARILAVTPISSRRRSRFQKQNSTPRSMEVRKLEKGKGSFSKKTLLPSFSRIFSRKKSMKFERGVPSYLPGESPL